MSGSRCKIQSAGFGTARGFTGPTGPTGPTGASGPAGIQGGYLKFSGSVFGPSTVYLTDNLGATSASPPTTNGITLAAGSADYPVPEAGVLTSFRVNLRTDAIDFGDAVTVFLSVNGADVAEAQYTNGTGAGQQQGIFTPPAPYPIVPGNVLNVRVVTTNPHLMTISAMVGIRTTP